MPPPPNKLPFRKSLMEEPEAKCRLEENFPARFRNKNCFSLAKIPKIPQDINDDVIFIKISLAIPILTSNFAVSFVTTNQIKEQRLISSAV